MRQPHHPDPDPIGPGQESVWDYPRPAIAEPTDRHVQVIHRGITLADSRKAWRTLETSHPPTYYIAPEDVARDYLVPNPSRRSLCEWKGQARYFDVVIADERIEAAVWAYSDPSGSFSGIADYFAFYPDPFDACMIDGEKITPQPGGFYGGWISRFEAGPFKGGPGSRFW